MVRSLYAGISGLRSHQVALDVTGNNIANVNTVGFKAGRATFKESMAQMLQGPSRPAGNQSGTNPLQIGLGTSIGSIDTMLRQGNLQTTGQITDLAIEGRAYFAFSSGNGVFYSRNGGLHLDADGYLISPTTGWRLQGKMADTFGNYSSGSVIGDLRIPWGEKAPAKATTEVEFGCNLNSDSQELGTVTHTNSFLRSAALGTGAALSVELDTASYEFFTMDGNTLGATFVAAKELARLENEINNAYSTIERYLNEIEIRTKEISDADEMIDAIDIEQAALVAANAPDPVGSAPNYLKDVDDNRKYTENISARASLVAKRADNATRISNLMNGTVATVGFDGINTLRQAVITPPPAGVLQTSIAAKEADRDQLRRYVAEQQTQDISSIANRTLLTALFDDGGNSLGIKGGDVITMETGDENIPAFKFTVLRESDVLPEDDPNYPHINYPMVGRTLEDFRKAMEGYLNAVQSLSFPAGMSSKEKTDMLNSSISTYVRNMDNDPTDHLDHRYETIYNSSGTPIGERESDIVTIDYNSDGSFKINNRTNESIPRFGVSTSRPGSSGYVSNVFSFTQPIHSLHAEKTVTMLDTATTDLDDEVSLWDMTDVTIADMALRSRGSASSGAIFIPATTEDRLVDVFDSKAKSLNLQTGDEINISGTVGVRGRKGSLEFNEELTLEDLLTEMQNAYNLPPTDGTIYQRPSISIKQIGDGNDDSIPLGSIILRGVPGEAFKLEGLTVHAKDKNLADPPPPTAFSSNMSFTYIQDARAAEIRSIEGKVYDDSGDEHTMKVTFIPLQEPGEWLWEISLSGDQRILGGNTGKVTFMNGTPSSVIFDDNSNTFRFDPMNGSNEVEMKIDFGAPKSTQGVTQYKSTTTTEFKYQDGYPMGKLEEIYINEKGEIGGKYTNGITKAIGMIYLAEFNNPAGLLKTGNSMFAVSPNSGQAVMHQPSIGTPSTIKPGALEMSNVELETEFTNMITIQRGYQANARVITTSDSMLQELVQLVR